MAAGGREPRIGSNAQCRPHVAPSSIQRFSSSTWRGLSGRFAFGGGMTSAGSSLVIRATSSLSVALAGHDHRALGAEGLLLHVEPEVGLAAGRVRAVAAEAMVGEDRQDVAAEVHAVRPVRSGRRGGQGDEEQGAPGARALRDCGHGVLGRDRGVVVRRGGRLYYRRRLDGGQRNIAGSTGPWQLAFSIASGLMVDRRTQLVPRSVRLASVQILLRASNQSPMPHARCQVDR